MLFAGLCGVAWRRLEDEILHGPPKKIHCPSEYYMLHVSKKRSRKWDKSVFRNNQTRRMKVKETERFCQKKTSQLKKLLRKRKLLPNINALFDKYSFFRAKTES